jgi:hypothetical protein
VWKRFNRGRNDQIWYFDALLSVFNATGTNRIVRELERVVEELRRISSGETA